MSISPQFRKLHWGLLASLIFDSNLITSWYKNSFSIDPKYQVRHFDNSLEINSD